MAWWVIDGPGGYVSWTPCADERPTVLNKIPGRDSPNARYNGDEPVELLDKFIAKIADKMQDAAYLEEIRLGIAGFPVDTNVISDEVGFELYRVREKIARVYVREWGRPPYEDELRGLFNFCTQPFQLSNEN